MAKKTVVMRVCDLHRGDVGAVKTVQMSWNGHNYQLDLCDEHLSELDSAVGGWTARARPPAGGARRGPRKSAATRRASRPSKRPAKRPAKRTARRRSSAGGNSAQVRQWAKANGLTVNSRGRIPGEVRAAYEAAQR